MTKYALYKQLGMSYQNFNNMVTNKTRSIKYDMIETLCIIFDCEPSNLFDYDLIKNKKEGDEENEGV